MLESLPIAVLQNVFRMVHVPFSHDAQDARDRMRLGLICSRLRDIAIGDTTLWHDVNDLIGGDEAFSAIVARSGAMPLSVRLTRVYGVYTEVQVLLGDAVWRLERFEVASAERMTWRWMPLFRASLPRLRHVYIHATRPCVLAGAPILGFNPATFFTTCLSLDSLFLHNVSWNLATFHVPTTLKTLSIEFTVRRSMFSKTLASVAPTESDFWIDDPLDYKVPYITTILQWLVRIPSLENLNIEGVFADDRSDSAPRWDARTDLVEMKALKVLYLRGALAGMTRFLHTIHTPGLLELVLNLSSFDCHSDILRAAPPRLLARPAYLTATVTLTANDVSSQGAYERAPVHLHLHDTPDYSTRGGVLCVHFQDHGEQGIHTFLTSPLFSINSLVISRRRLERISPLTIGQWQDIGRTHAHLEELNIRVMMAWVVNLGEAMSVSLNAGEQFWPHLRIVKFGTMLSDVDEAMTWTIWLRALCLRRRSGLYCTVIIGDIVLTAHTLESIILIIPRAAHTYLIDLV